MYPPQASDVLGGPDLQYLAMDPSLLETKIGSRRRLTLNRVGTPALEIRCLDRNMNEFQTDPPGSDRWVEHTGVDSPVRVLFV
jgi:hypothetical protein